MIDNVESAWHVYAALKQYQNRNPSLHNDLLFQQVINEAFNHFTSLFLRQPKEVSGSPKTEEFDIRLGVKK